MSTPASRNDDADTTGKCTHAACSCPVAGVTRNDRHYCSDGCAAGAGCAHPDCNCAAYDTRMRGE